MATALMEPLVKTGLQRAENMFVYDVFPSAMQKVSDRLGVQMAGSLPELVQDADLVICAVKPQNLTADFFRELRKGTPHEDAILLSVVAGKSIHVFSHEGGFQKVVRSMPNTPAQIGSGMTVWSCTNNLTVTDREKIRKILDSCGKSMYVDSEQFIDMSTSISGSGPAYIFLLMESLIDGGKIMRSLHIKHPLKIYVG